MVGRVDKAPAGALLFITAACPHCPGVLRTLGDLVKEGVLGRLSVINLDRQPDAADALGVRSVPWVRIGAFVLTGVQDRAAYAHWAHMAEAGEGWEDYLHALLRDGELARVQALVEEDPARLRCLLPVLANPEAALNVRLGANVVFEHHAGGEPLRALAVELEELAQHADHRVRADACHLLGLTGLPGVRPFLQARLADEHADVRDIAADALQSLPDH